MSEYPQKPEAAIGALVLKDQKVLLVKRSQSPSKGLWALPGGKINLGETLQQAVMREVFEETGVSVIPLQPIYSFDSIHKDGKGNTQFHYVIVDLLAEYKGGELKAGDDAAEVGWFSLQDLKRISVNEKTRELVLRYLNSERSEK
jgi:8-oxo-dGTP diphosphatase